MEFLLGALLGGFLFFLGVYLYSAAGGKIGLRGKIKDKTYDLEGDFTTVTKNYTLFFGVLTVAFMLALYL